MYGVLLYMIAENYMGCSRRPKLRGFAAQVDGGMNDVIEASSATAPPRLTTKAILFNTPTVPCVPAHDTMPTEAIAAGEEKFRCACGRDDCFIMRVQGRNPGYFSIKCRRRDCKFEEDLKPALEAALRRVCKGNKKFMKDAESFVRKKVKIVRDKGELRFAMIHLNAELVDVWRRHPVSGVPRTFRVKPGTTWTTLLSPANFTYGLQPWPDDKMCCYYNRSNGWWYSTPGFSPGKLQGSI